MKPVARIGLLLSLWSAGVAMASELSTAQRLELVERRVNLVTDLTLQIEQLRRENRELRGTVENLGYQIEQLERKQRDLYLDIDQRLGALGGAPAAAGAASPASTAAAPVIDAPPPATAAAAVQSVSPADPAQVAAEYQAAYDLLSPQQKRYDEAAQAFAAFVARYPDDALTPNAQYWLGEAHYVSQRNAEALAAFQAVVERFPTSNKAPGALFKIGRLQQARGDSQAARASYARVVKDYPDSPAAGLARQRLDLLGQ